jgi:hypothetical protein
MLPTCRCYSTEIWPEGPVHLHISEQPAEVSKPVWNISGCRPIELLLIACRAGRALVPDSCHARQRSRSRTCWPKVLVPVVGHLPDHRSGSRRRPVSSLRVSKRRRSRSHRFRQQPDGLRGRGTPPARMGTAPAGLHQRNVLCQPESNIATANSGSRPRSSGADALQQPVGRTGGGPARGPGWSSATPIRCLPACPRPNNSMLIVFAHAPDMIDARFRER